MNALLRTSLLAFAGLLFAGAGNGAWAQAQSAGRFVSVTGDVSLVGSDGSRRTAERGGDIREGDTIVTGPAALAQARMSDGGLISVRADSEFKLEQFGYKGREDRSASFVVSILKGGFRTITGLIAQVNRAGYKINTPAATIGVRGTHFEVVHVLPQIATTDVPAGTYNRVFEGITTVQNPGGPLLQVVREQTAFASLQGGSPVLVAPPALIFGRPTPVPRAAVPQGDAHKAAAIKGESRVSKIQERAFKLEDRGLKRADRPTVVVDRPTEAPTPLRSVPLTPIDTATTLQIAPTTTISPTTTTILQSPTTTTIKLDTSTSTILSPTTTTTTTTISPTTSTILQSPTTTTLSPTTTTISPTTTTIQR
jgi:hypothetical protein